MSSKNLKDFHKIEIVRNITSTMKTQLMTTLLKGMKRGVTTENLSKTLSFFYSP